MKVEWHEEGDSLKIEKNTTHKVKCPILNNYVGDYRLEYDGKYVTLFGGDLRYKGFKYNNDSEDWFEEMVLVPVVAEVRNANPFISDIGNKFIIVTLNEIETM